MSPDLIIWPMVLIALTTIWLYFPMSSARVASVKAGKTKASVYRHNIGEPEESLRFNNAIKNQYESPIMFYAVCLASYVTQNANVLMVGLAFAYAITKIVHVYVHTNSNRLRIRRPIFALSLAILLIMWLVLAVLLTGLI